MKKSFFALSFGGLCAASGLHAAEASVSSIKFSHPEKSEVVHITVARGAVRVIASDSKDAVTVSSTARTDKKERPRADGLRVIGSGASYLLTENENVVTFNYGSFQNGFSPEAEFEITIPAQASLQINNGAGGEMSVDGIKGDLELKNMNGEVELTNIGGAVLAETMNGGIKAKIATLVSGKALSFTSMSGQIELELPADAKANLRFRTQNGSILTDFPEDVLKTKTEPLSADAPGLDVARQAREVARQAARLAREQAREVYDGERRANGDTSATAAPNVPRPPRAPIIPSMVGGNVVSGTLNGGGVDLQVATMNGDIVVRTTKTTKP